MMGQREATGLGFARQMLAGSGGAGTAGLICADLLRASGLASTGTLYACQRNGNTPLRSRVSLDPILTHEAYM